MPTVVRNGLVLYLLLHDSQRVRGVALSLYLAQLALLALEKERMLEDLEVGIFLLEFVEVVHVQLPLKRAEVVMFEISGEDCVAELCQL